MNSWWELGEGFGQAGSELNLHSVSCAFCLERGNFTLEHRGQKAKPNQEKVLVFDTYKCGNCAGFVFVLWSSNSHSYGFNGIHAFRQLPWPIEIDQYPDHWPVKIGRYWLQAARALEREDWDSAIVMTRSALQIALRDHGAQGSNLKQEIDNLAASGFLPPHMKDWAHALRELGNESAHPDPRDAGPEPSDAKDMFEFLHFLIKYLYDLPHQISGYR